MTDIIVSNEPSTTVVVNTTSSSTIVDNVTESTIIEDQASSTTINESTTSSETVTITGDVDILINSLDGTSTIIESGILIGSGVATPFELYEQEAAFTNAQASTLPPLYLRLNPVTHKLYLGRVT